MRKDLVYGCEDDEIGRIGYGCSSESKYLPPEPVPEYEIHSAFPPEFSSPGAVYEAPELVYATPVNDFFSYDMKAVKKIALALLIVNSLLITNVGMEIKRDVASKAAACLEIIVGRDKADGFCHLAHHTFSFASGYVRKSLTWIDYRHKCF